MGRLGSCTMNQGRLSDHKVCTWCIFIARERRSDKCKHGYRSRGSACRLGTYSSHIGSGQSCTWRRIEDLETAATSPPSHTSKNILLLGLGLRGHDWEGNDGDLEEWGNVALLGRGRECRAVEERSAIWWRRVRRRGSAHNVK